MIEIVCCQGCVKTDVCKYLKEIEAVRDSIVCKDVDAKELENQGFTFQLNVKCPYVASVIIKDIKDKDDNSIKVPDPVPADPSPNTGFAGWPQPYIRDVWHQGVDYPIGTWCKTTTTYK